MLGKLDENLFVSMKASVIASESKTCRNRGVSFTFGIKSMELMIMSDDWIRFEAGNLQQELLN